jgi:hypothetical protein
MKISLALKLILFLIITILFSCGDFYSYEPVRIEMLSFANGDTLKKNDDVYFNIIVDDQETHPQALTIDLIGSNGQVMASNTMLSPEVNKEIVLSDLINSELNLPYGEYNLAFTLKSDKEIIYQKQWVFFYVNEEYKIKGVWSYPWVIEPNDKALLIADLKTSPSLNPYIRWSQNNVVFAKGLLSDGLDQILWETPAKEGVYSITVEYFPFAPSRSNDFNFNSKTAMTAELYVSSPQKDADSPKKDRNIYYNLFDIYLHAKDQLHKLRPSLSQTPIKNPKIILKEDMIGFQLDGRTGFICDEMIIPLKNNQLKSYNISLGFTPQAEQTSRTLFYLYSENGSFSLHYLFNETQSPMVIMTVNGFSISFFSGIRDLRVGERYVIDFAMIVSGDILKTVWKLNGTTTSTIQNAFSFKNITGTGVSILGGNNSCIGVIDMLDIVLLEENEISSLTAPGEPLLAKRLK